MPKKHPRPAKDFTVTSLRWERDIERRHQEAGFGEIPDEVIVRRFWQFLRFLQQHGLTLHIIAHSAEELTDDSTLRNSDLTDKGYYFIQRFQGRWVNRTHKDCGETKEDAFLVKWYDQFLAEYEAV